MLGAIAAKSGAAGNIDDPSASATVEEVRDGEAAEIGRRLQVDGQRSRPGRMPFVVGRIICDCFIDSGIVDEHVDLTAELVERGVPYVARGRGVGEITGDQRVATLG